MIHIQCVTNGVDTRITFRANFVLSFSYHFIEFSFPLRFIFISCFISQVQKFEMPQINQFSTKNLYHMIVQFVDYKAVTQNPLPLK